MVKLLECDDDVHTAFKLSAVSKGISMKSILKKLIQDYLKSEKESSKTLS